MERLEDFDQFAEDYKEILDKSLKFGGEKGDYFSKYKSMYVSRCMGKGFSGKILDYGCGIGLLSGFLLKALPQAAVHGYDVSSVSIKHVPAYLKDQGRFTSDINSLHQDYDLIVIANVLHHIEPSQREAVIIKLNKLLKAGGKIIIFEHNPFNPLTRKIVKDSPLDKGVVLLRPAETCFYLKKAGFQERQLNYIVFFPKALSVLRWAEPLLCWLPLGAQYVTMAKVNSYAKT